MTLVRTTVENAAIGIAVADQAEHLKAFLQPGCAATIWRRQCDQSLQHWIDALDPARLPQGRVVVRPDAVQLALVGFCAASKTPECRQRDHLFNDIAALAGVFSRLMKAPFVRLRLQAVTTNACQKFHIDAITARLVCTYRGAGTQYGISTNGTVPARVFSVPTGAPVLLRGTRWPANPPSGLLHRSPPIEGTGETRLVLVLDPVYDGEDSE